MLLDGIGCFCFWPDGTKQFRFVSHRFSQILPVFAVFDLAASTCALRNITWRRHARRASGRVHTHGQHVRADAHFVPSESLQNAVSSTCMITARPFSPRRRGPKLPLLHFIASCAARVASQNRAVKSGTCGVALEPSCVLLGSHVKVDMRMWGASKHSCSSAEQLRPSHPGGRTILRTHIQPLRSECPFTKCLVPNRTQRHEFTC